MNRTIFDTPVLNEIMPPVAKVILYLCGWRVEGEKPDIPSYVMIAAPHTSNWDFPLTLLISFALGLRIQAMGKDSLVKGPWGFLFKWLGVIPVDRSKSNNLVAQSITNFQERSELVLVVSPAGTRSRTMRWKTGFYHIAHGAGVPIMLGFLDYGNKCGGIKGIFTPTGDIEGDFDRIKASYKGVTGKFPHKQVTPA